MVLPNATRTHLLKRELSREVAVVQAIYKLVLAWQTRKYEWNDRDTNIGYTTMFGSKGERLKVVPTRLCGALCKITSFNHTFFQ